MVDLTWLGAGAAGAILLKIVELLLSHFLDRPAQELQATQQLLNPLLSDAKSTRDELNQAQAQMAEWREKYFALADELNNAREDLRQARAEIVGLKTKSVPPAAQAST